jgi:hypothetical protein
MANQQRDPKKEATWRKHLRLWKRSGLSVRQFCQLHQIPEPSFYYWRRRLHDQDSLATRTVDGTTPQAGPEPTDPMPLFVPLRLPTSSQPVLVVLADGTQIHVPADFDPHALRRLLDVLRGGPC